MAITLRAVTGSALTHNQVDLNFSSYFYTASLSGQVLSLIYPSSSFSAIPSMSITLPSASKWSDISGGGITRTSTVEVTGSFNNSGSTSIVGNLTNGNSQLIALNSSHAQGDTTIASGSFSHTEGNRTVATGSYSHAEGESSQAKGDSSHAEGKQTTTIGEHSHAEGNGTIAFGTGSHAEGNGAIASGSYSHAEGLSTVARGEHSHAEGYQSIAAGSGSHAEGYQTQAVANYSHAEGKTTYAYGEYAHAEGQYSQASGSWSHAEGFATQAKGQYSHTEGQYTVASGSYQHVQGQFNISSSIDSAFIIGNGTADESRSNLVFAAGSTFQITGSLNVSSDIVLPGTSSIYFGEKSLSTTSSFGIFKTANGRMSIGNNIGSEGYGADGIAINNQGKVQFNTVSQGYSLYDTTLTIIGSGSNDGITMTQFPDIQNQYRITVQSGSQYKMNFKNNLHPTSGSFDFSGSVNISEVVKLTPKLTTPTAPEEGMIIASGSAGASILYYYNGTTWNALF